MNQRKYQWFGIVLVILTFSIVLIWGIRVTSAIRSLKINLDNAQKLISVDNPLTIDPDEITEIITSSRESVMNIKRDTRFLLRIAPHLSWIPKVGPLLSELPDILLLADTATQTALDLWSLAQPTYAQIQEQGVQVKELINLFPLSKQPRRKFSIPFLRGFTQIL